VLRGMGAPDFDRVYQYLIHTRQTAKTLLFVAPQFLFQDHHRRGCRGLRGAS